MGFAFVNVFGVESFAALWPLMLIYCAVAAALAAQWAVTRNRPILLAGATVLGLIGGSFLGHLTTNPCPAVRATMTTALDWELTVAEAADRVDRHKEILARYIDENLATIPEVMHANCREIQDALAARGLLCVDVGPDTGRNDNSIRGEGKAFALWHAYRAAKDDLDSLLSDAPLP